MNVIAIIRAVVLSPFYLLVVSLKLLLLAKLLYRWNFPLSQIPGPKAAIWTRFWWIKLISRSKTDKEMVRLYKEYGRCSPVVRIAPQSILVSDPDTTRIVLAVGSEFKRGPWFDSLRLDPATTNVVSERDPKKHQQLRAILSSGLSGKDVLDMEPTVDEHIGEYLRMLDEKSASANGNAIKLDLSQSIPHLTLDIITHLCLGESFQCIENENDRYGFLDALNCGMIFQQYISVLLEATNLLLYLGKLPFVRSRLFPNVNSSDGIGRVMLVIRKAVERKLAENEKGAPKKDMLDSFLSRGLSINQATSELVVVISSGVGATSYAIQGIIRSIVANPDVVRKLQNEIDEVIAKRGKKSLRRVENSVIKQMPYLQACISEGLRMYPPIFSQLRERVVPPEGVVLHGYAVPGGTFVGFNSVASQLNPIYGDKFEEFHPERWLIDDEIRLKRMHRNLELVFGHGSSKCLGVNMANVELNKIIFELFRNYDISFANPEVPWKARGDFVLSDFHVTIERRGTQCICNSISSHE
ncbi:cytochrome P450 [Zopfia rhizophila CBS 207.26]|uniref:Cytochrome P450 n=1 Tax=Zopfia rhizophila CBS 207.26 TaxID=1314779 RepID=A0A6A6DMJ4_9PEZI|nr:cytochrome P450 [Zopfia rhizophila CBS 207.26]